MLSNEALNSIQFIPAGDTVPYPQSEYLEVPLSDFRATVSSLDKELVEQGETLAKAHEAIALIEQPRSFVPKKGGNLLFDHLSATLTAEEDEANQARLMAAAAATVSELEESVADLEVRRDYCQLEAEYFELMASLAPMQKAYNAAIADAQAALDKVLKKSDELAFFQDVVSTRSRAIPGQFEQQFYPDKVELKIWNGKAGESPYAL